MPATVKCPTCGRPVEWVDTEKFRPFCSERCKLIDLGEWATGSYAIPGEPEDRPEETGSTDPGDLDR
jgi:endogenous inhibitor of DNA gyrase (YacG/DUF329 family)